MTDTDAQKKTILPYSGFEILFLYSVNRFYSLPMTYFFEVLDLGLKR